MAKQVNNEMLKQVQHDKKGIVTLNLFQGLLSSVSLNSFQGLLSSVSLNSFQGLKIKSTL
jgi:hypothetical protein